MYNIKYLNLFGCVSVCVSSIFFYRRILFFIFGISFSVCIGISYVYDVINIKCLGRF